MYTVRSDKRLNQVTVVVLQALHQIAEQHKASYFIIGATARDILMTHVFGIDATRATRDVDFAIALKDWEQFEVIKQKFVDGADFQPSSNEAHRLYYRQGEYGTAYPLDLIPFGGIESPGHHIAWAPDMAVVMNVAGYAEALGIGCPSGYRYRPNRERRFDTSAGGPQAARLERSGFNRRQGCAGSLLLA